MKRGPKQNSNQSSKKTKIDAESKAHVARVRAEQALSVSPFAKLVDDATKVIFNNLPEYSFMGDNSVNQVCHYFNNLTNEYKAEYKREITKEKLLKNCRDEIDALHILRDNALCNELSIKEILGVVSLAPEIIEALLKWDTFNSNDYKKLLCILGKNNLHAAKKLIENKKRGMYFGLRQGETRWASELYDLQDFYKALAPFQYEIAAEYVHNRDRNIPYGSWDYINSKVSIGKYHEKLAFELIEEFGDKLTEANLKDLAKHFEVFLHIMNNAHLRSKLSKWSLHELGCENYIVLEYISKDHELKKQFDDLEYSHMQYSHPKLFNENDLAEYLKSNPYKASEFLMNLCLKNKALACQILSSEQLFGWICFDHFTKILTAHHELHRQIINNTFTLAPSIGHFTIKEQNGVLDVLRTTISGSSRQWIELNDDVPLCQLSNPSKIKSSDENSEEHINITLLNFIKQKAKEIDPAEIVERQMKRQLKL